MWLLQGSSFLSNELYTKYGNVSRFFQKGNMLVSLLQVSSFLCNQLNTITGKVSHNFS